jgi:hypothetical protein
MSHTYVLAESNKWVDFDRASFLMDKDILEEALRVMREELANWPDPFDEACARRMGSPPLKFNAPQRVWNYYCKRHKQKYREDFAPNVKSGWDQGGAAREVKRLPVRESQLANDSIDPSQIRVLTAASFPRPPASASPAARRARRKRRG